MNKMKVKSETRSNYEKNLVKKMQTGSSAEKQQAFNELYKRHYEALFFFCLKKHQGNKQTAQDTLQEVFVKVYTKIDSFDQQRSVFSTWLYTVANNFIVDQIRKKNVEVLSYDNLLPSAEDNPDSAGKTYEFQIEDVNAINSHDILVAKERRQIVLETIDLMKHRNCKNVMKMFYLQQMSHKEISAKLNMAVGTIKCLIFRGNKYLKTHLEKIQFEFAA